MAAMVAVALGGAAAAHAEPPASTAPSAVTVVLENNTMVSVEGTDTSYRLTVRNNSPVDYPQALITQMLPPALTFGTADPAPSKVTESKLEGITTAELQWIRHLPPFGEVTIDMHGVVSKPAKGKTAVTTTACVLPDGVTRPLICDSDTDSFRPGSSFGGLWWGLAGGIVAAAGVFWWRRSRRKPDAPVAPSPLRQLLRSAKPAAYSAEGRK